MASTAWWATVGVVLALAWCAWVVDLAGLSTAQRHCADGGPGTDTAVGQWWYLRGYAGSCTSMYRLWWFILWMTFAALFVFSIMMGATPATLHRTQFSWLAVWSVLALLWILKADAWLSTQNTNFFTQGVEQSYSRTVIAGSIMLSTLIWLLAILMGFKHKRRAEGVGPVKF